MQLALYTDKVKLFESEINSAKNIAHELNMYNAADNAERILESIKTDAFHLVIVGEFSRGKSTFVNALLGKRILPASKNPTTAIISKITYGKKPAYKIFYKGRGTSQNLSEDEFIKLTAPKEPDPNDSAAVREYARQQKNIEDIDHAEIIQPLKFCRDNVEVVDTPGTNDLNLGRMEITYGYLNKADACILLLSATQPLSRSEAEFLKDRILGNKIQDIFFIISRKDQLRGDIKEEQRVIDFVKNNLKKILPSNFKLQNRIFLVSSRVAMIYRRKQDGEILKPKMEAELPTNIEETGFSEFEECLSYFLANEKGVIKLRRYVRDSLKILGTMQHDLSINIGVVAHSTDEIRRKVSTMEDRFKTANRKAEKIIRDMRVNFQSAGNDIESQCKSAAQSIIMKAKAAVNNLNKDMSDSEMKNLIEREVSTEKKNFIENTIQNWQKIFDREHSKTTDALKDIWADIDLEYRREFNLPALMNAGSASIEIYVDRSESFYDAASRYIGRAFDSGRNFLERSLNFIGGLFSAAFGVVKDVYNSFTGTSDSRKDWRDEIRNTIDKTYRSLDKDMSKTLSQQYNQKSDEMCNGFQNGIDARIKDMESQLKNILREKESQEQDAARKRNYLLQKQAEIQRIENNLNSLV